MAKLKKPIRKSSTATMYCFVSALLIILLTLFGISFFTRTSIIEISGSVKYKDKEIIDRGVASRYKDNLTMYCLFIDNFNHQSTFIKRELFEEYGLYSEDYLIVSDWLFFLQAVLHGSTVEYIDLTIVYFDMLGISFSNIELREQERVAAISTILPLSILKDYEYFRKIERKAQFFDSIFRYKFTYDIARFVMRSVRYIVRLNKFESGNTIV